jgi:hypothetical protein
MSAAAPVAGDPGTAPGTALAAATPLLLLPVRIETRFVDTTDGVAYLLVRVYPDTISVSSFEPALTLDEVPAGTAYWNLIWAAGNPPPDPDAAQAPWRVLAGAFQPQRAAWIALTMTPTNLAQQPATPTPQDQAPSPAPIFPRPPTRASSYEQAPTAQALPDAWTVILYNGQTSRQVTLTPITPGLAVGLTPHDGTLPDGLPVDAGMRWLVDFDDAVKHGMAARIELSRIERAVGFDRLVVLGLRDAKADASGDVSLTALLNAHHYTDGIAFVPQGAPTNNTPDASSAFSRKDPNYDVSFRVERGAPLTAAADADGPVTAGLLGIPTATFDHVQYADAYGVRNGRDMLTALWPATLGYFMDQMMSPVFGADALETARTTALAAAIPRGALPALRVGNTPYGVLPVTSLAAYAPPRPTFAVLPDPEAALVGFLKLLLPAWQSSIPGVPRIGGTSDPDQDLTRVLGMDASSVDFRARQVIGDEAMWNLLQFLETFATQEWWLEHLVRGRALLDGLGLTTWDPRVIHTSMARSSYLVPFSTVRDGAPSETAPLANDASVGGQNINYIQWLRGASLPDLQTENYPGPLPTSLLYRILRQSVLRDYVSLAGLAQVNAGTLPAVALREAELVHIRQAAPSITPWDILNQPRPGSTVTWGQYLHDLIPAPGSEFWRLAQLRASMDNLAALPTAELDRLLTETLDAGSHRLDVWITAIANSILQRQRAAAPQQGAPTLHLGGYGWVENVRPAARPRVVTGADSTAVVRLDESRRAKFPGIAVPGQVLQAPPDNGGFIHAPSMTQAAAGAILRSGYMSHRNTPDEPVLAIALSSQRTQNALWLLEGVRQGQTLGALTGYKFEQALHDANLDVYVQPFRDKYPLIGTELTPQTAAGEVVPPSQVVDGVKLRADWQAGNLAPGTVWGTGLPIPAPPANATQTTVLGFISDLDDMLGGLGDLSLAESVFQIMRGNFGRAGGLLDAVSQGAEPPLPDVVDTPRAGIDVTHRLMLLFAGAPPAVPAWSGVPTRPRALAEPWLSNWVAARLPDPSVVRCAVSWTEAGATQTTTVALGDLMVGPLDVLALAIAGGEPQRSELESRILYAAAPPSDATAVTITYATTTLPAGTIGFPDLLTAAQAVRDMLGLARALRPQDFSPPETNAANAGGTTDMGDLTARVQALVGQLGTDITALQTAIANVATAPQPVRDALLTASFYGINGSVPQSTDDTTALTARANATLGQMQQRQSAASQTPLPPPVPATAVSALLGVVATVLGKAAIVLPHLTPADPASVQSAFGQSAAMQAVDPQAMDRWMLQLSHIRAAVQRFDLGMSATALLGAPEAPPLTLGQLPFVAGDRWLGLPILSAAPPTSGRVAIEALAVGDPTTPAPLAGLLLDEWLDRIPATTTSAGLSFHHDEPTARAPQAMLLAVCPDGRQAWDLALVQTILEETLELAKIRAVDLDSIQQVGQILPGLYVPFNLQAATVGTQFLLSGAALGNILTAPG